MKILYEKIHNSFVNNTTMWKNSKAGHLSGILSVFCLKYLEKKSLPPRLCVIYKKEEVQYFSLLFKLTFDVEFTKHFWYLEHILKIKLTQPFTAPLKKVGVRNKMRKLISVG